MPRDPERSRGEIPRPPEPDGESLQARFMTQDNANLWLVVLTAAIAFSTSLYCFFSYRLAAETVALRRAQSQPCVLIYPQASMTGTDAVDLIIHNIGPGVARDISFSPNRKFGQLNFETGKSAPFESGPLVHGITMLGPGQFRTIAWGRTDHVRAFLGEGTLSVIVEFARLDDPSEREHTTNPLEIGGLLGTRLNSTPFHDIAAELGRLTQLVSSAFPAPRINSDSSIEKT